VLVNAYQDGVLDRGRTGHYKLNSVGENLVAMALPGTAEAGKSPTKKAANGRRKGSGRKKGVRKGRKPMADLVGPIDAAVGAVTRLRGSLHKNKNRQVRNSDGRALISRLIPSGHPQALGRCTTA
jgi:hypothetical protein